jgi:ABC-type transport system involved in multi-copper enzyme maturation permease subunit
MINQKKPAPKKAPPYKFGKPQKVSLLVPVLSWLFIVIGIIGIAWMIILNPPQKKLKCDYNPTPSLLAFGTCHEE